MMKRLLLLLLALLMVGGLAGAQESGIAGELNQGQLAAVGHGEILVAQRAYQSANRRLVRKVLQTTSGGDPGVSIRIRAQALQQCVTHGF